MGLRVKGLSPYRVEWRANLTQRYILMEECDTHEGALDEAEKVRDKHRGYTRVISQHVIDTNDPTLNGSA